MPETSIVIRTFNEERHIGNLLAALQRQAYKHFEIIIVDSGSTDKTLEIAAQFPAKVISIESRDFTFGYALNVGCKAARGKYVVCASAHVLPVNEHWLADLVAPFKDEKIAMVYGSQRAVPQTKFSERRDFLRLFGKLPINSNVPIYYANNANSAVRKALWDKRPFDEYLFGLEDIDWARAMVKEGFLVHYAPKAGIFHIHEETWAQVFNRYRREAIAAVRIGMPHPPQARLSHAWFVWRIIDDLYYSIPNWSPRRVREIVWFRYYQWSGSRQGWYKDKGLDLDRDKYELYFPEANTALTVIDGKIVIQKIPLQDLKPGDILVKVEYARVDDVDFGALEGKGAPSVTPIVLGSAFIGTIIKIGASNKLREQYRVGDRVAGPAPDGAYRQFIIVPGDLIQHVSNEIEVRDMPQQN